MGYGSSQVLWEQSRSKTGSWGAQACKGKGSTWEGDGKGQAKRQEKKPELWVGGVGIRQDRREFDQKLHRPPSG